MEILTPKFNVKPLDGASLEWFVKVAATKMLLDELQRPELLNEEQMYVLAEKAMFDKTAFIGYCYDEPVGAIGGLVIPNLFNPEFINLAEIFWYVLPEYRNSRIGAMLLFEFDQLGQKIADETTLSLLKTSPLAIRSLEKRGFMASELAFRKPNMGN